jgi:hypothetical protein
MEKLSACAGRFFLALIVALAAGCHAEPAIELTDAQQSELTAHAGVYHVCVAQIAARMDDGQSPVTRIARIALSYCKPEAAQVAAYLDSIKLPADAKALYLDQLSDIAARESALMLRRHRHPDWQSDNA